MKVSAENLMSFTKKDVITLDACSKVSVCQKLVTVRETVIIDMAIRLVSGSRYRLLVLGWRTRGRKIGIQGC